MWRYDAFISYSRMNGDRVEPLVQLLRDRGYRVFFDQQEIVVADKWKDRLSQSVAASRVLVLCWSRDAAASEYVRYELFRAEGLKRPVLPWLLDETELPKLVEIQGIKQQDPAEIFERLKPRLGLQLRWRRALQWVVLLAIAGAALAGYRWVHRPWILTGVVRATTTEAPLEDVTVEVTTPDGRHYPGHTNADGYYSIVIPLPKTPTVDVLFWKQAYESDHELNVTTATRYTMYLKPN